MIRKFKINGLPTDKVFNAQAFGQQLAGLKMIEAFKKTAKVIHLSQKRQSYTKAIKEAIALYDVKQYFCTFHCDAMCKDDSFEFFYV